MHSDAHDLTAGRVPEAPWPRRRVLAALALPTLPLIAQPARDATAIARLLAERYTVNAPLGYVGALIGSAQRRIGGALPARSQQTMAALRQAAATTPPADWPLRAGYAALAEAARFDGDTVAGDLAREAVRSAIVDTPAGPRLKGLRAWTDDLFMPVLLLDRTLPLLPDIERQRATEALGASLLDLAAKLQRPDGLFDHAEGSPIAWGRGNGFAGLALALALAGTVPPTSPAGAPLLARLKRHLRALLPLQAPDGLWRQVLDQPQSSGELTVTAMTLTALALARRFGWLPAGPADAAITRAWAGVQAHVDADGDFSDVCAGTPAGSTLDFYLQRPIVNGRDDRAAAMVLWAALHLPP